MQVQVIDNVSRTMIGVLSEATARSEDIRMAVAFVSQSGLAMLQPYMDSTLQAAAHVEFLVGLDMQTTEPAALHTLYEMTQTNPRVELYCYASLAQTAIYHPKLYLLRRANEVTSIVGSSNLTRGGLKSNIEINVVITGNTDEEPISDSYNSYNRLKFHPGRVIPDEEYIELYREICEQRKKQRRGGKEGTASNDKLRTFKEKALSLQHPKPTRRDVVGWLELVYDALPAGEFTNEQAYANEQLFQQKFPVNRNIKAKIRQQLQWLRDMGLIEHLGAGHWKKM